MNIFQIPSIMLVSAQAIWNPTDGCWDVVL